MDSGIPVEPSGIVQLARGRIYNRYWVYRINFRRVCGVVHRDDNPAGSPKRRTYLAHIVLQTLAAPGAATSCDLRDSWLRFMSLNMLRADA